MAQEENAAVGIYERHIAAEMVVRKLRDSGFDMKRVSVAGRDDHSGSQTIGYYHNGSGIHYWGDLKGFWGPLWGLLSGWAFFAVPGIGPVLVAGPLAGWTVAALDNAAIFGGLTPLGASLYSIGIPKDGVLSCETALRNGKFLVLVHGTAGEISRAKGILELSTAMTGRPTALRQRAEHFA
jgi:hypothetical protein